MGKCKAITKSGNRCKNESTEDSDFCHIKSHQEQEDGSDNQCQATTGEGKQCSYSAKEGSDYCGIHSDGYKGGRPLALKGADYDQVEKLTRLGATDKDLAEFYKVDEATINRQKKRDEEFCKSLKRGKEKADAEVADRLYQRAIGYSHKDVHISNYQGEVTITPITKHYPPDTTAAIFWLKNRRPDLWRDRQEVDWRDKTNRDFDGDEDPMDYINEQLSKDKG